MSATETVEQQEQLPIAVIKPQPMALTPVGSFDDFKSNLNAMKKFIGELFDEGVDQGTIPGTNKPTLYKPGADKLCEFYGFYDEYETVQRVENWDAQPALFDYEFKCTLKSRRDDRIVATGMGSCNSWETRYRWREGKRLCPQCEQPAIKRSQFPDKKTGDKGWYCYGKIGGCGANFHSEDKSITGQETGRIPNPDIADVKNTVLKQAKKRAKVDAVLAATRSSGLFTQDLEDFRRDDDDVVEAEVKEPAKKPPQKPAATTKTNTKTTGDGGKQPPTTTKEATTKEPPKTTEPESSAQDAELDSLFTDNQVQDAEIVSTDDGDVPEVLANFMTWIDAERVMSDPPIDQIKVALTGIYDSLLPGNDPEGKPRSKQELNKFMSSVRVPDAPVSEWLTWEVATDAAMNAYTLSRA